MKYLYGNSSLSDLDQNYLEFLRLSLDFSVEVLQSETRISKILAAIEEAKKLAEIERAQVGALSDKVNTLLNDAPGSDSKVITISLRDSMVKACGNELTRAYATIEANLQNFIRQSSDDIASERTANVHRLEKVLQHCDLPNTKRTYTITLEPTGTYSGRLRCTSDNMLHTEMGLSIPPKNIFNDAIRTDAIIPDLQINLPEAGGWLKRGTKISPQRLSKEYVTCVSQTKQGFLISLRNAPKEGQAGYDILFNQSDITVSRISKQQEASDPYPVTDADAVLLRQLFVPLYAGAEEISWCRQSLESALIDQHPLNTYPEPDQLVLWLLAHMTPVVQNISRNTLSPGELVLKRVLGDGKREEMFLSKSELHGKLMGLVPAHRAYFAPLGLDRKNQDMGDLPEPTKSKIVVPQKDETAATVAIADAMRAGGPNLPTAASADAANAGPAPSPDAETADDSAALPPENTEDISLMIESDKSLTLELPDEQTSELDLSNLDEDDDSLILDTNSEMPPAPAKPPTPTSSGRGSLPPESPQEHRNVSSTRNTAPPGRGSIPPVRPSTLPPSGRPSAIPSAAPPPPPRNSSPGVKPPAPTGRPSKAPDSGTGRASLPPSNLGGQAKFGDTGRPSNPLIAVETKSPAAKHSKKQPSGKKTAQKKKAATKAAPKPQQTDDSTKSKSSE